MLISVSSEGFCAIFYSFRGWGFRACVRIGEDEAANIYKSNAQYYGGYNSEPPSHYIIAYIAHQ